MKQNMRRISQYFIRYIDVTFLGYLLTSKATIRAREGTIRAGAGIIIAKLELMSA